MIRKLNTTVEMPNVEALCGNCRWHSSMRGEKLEDGYGQCALYGHFENKFPSLAIKVPGDDSTVLLTHKDFGCVQFEATRMYL